MEGSVQINARESHSIEQEKKPMLSWDEIMEKSLSNFGWMDLLQAILVAIVMFFDARQLFLSIYTNGTAQTKTQIHHVLHPMIFSNSQGLLGLRTHSSNTIISQWNHECASTFITGLPQSSFLIGCLLGLSFLVLSSWPSLDNANIKVYDYEGYSWNVAPQNVPLCDSIEGATMKVHSCPRLNPNRTLNVSEK
jgi:hypothetical protein